MEKVPPSGEASEQDPLVGQDEPLPWHAPDILKRETALACVERFPGADVRLVARALVHATNFEPESAAAAISVRELAQLLRVDAERVVGSLETLCAFGLVSDCGVLFGYDRHRDHDEPHRFVWTRAFVEVVRDSERERLA